MIRDFQAAFRVSKMRKALILCMFIVGVCGVMGYFGGMMRWLLLAAMILTTAWAWREPHQVHHLMVDEFYQAWLLLADEEVLHEATLLSGSLIHRWGCFLKWRCDGRVFWQVVLPDMLDGDVFRRLRVWTMFGQKQ